MPISTKDYSEVSAEKKKMRGPPAAKCSIWLLQSIKGTPNGMDANVHKRLFRAFC
jgi:hypothetical protein